MRRIRWLFSVSRPHLRLGIAAALLLSVAAILAFAFPVASRYLVDHILPKRDVRTFVSLSLLLAFLYFIQAVFAITGNYLSSAFGHRTLRDVQLQLFHRALNLRMEVIDRLRFGDIATRVISDVAGIRSLLFDNLLQGFKDALTLSAGFAIMMWLDFRLALLALPGIFVIYVLSQTFSKRAKAKTKSLQQKISALTNAILDPLFNFIIVKAYTLERIFFFKTKKLVNEYATERVTWELLNASASQMVTFFTSVGTLIILWYGGNAIMQGSMSLGKLVAISFVFSQLASAAQRLSNFNLQYKSSLASLERIDELQQLPIEFSSSTEDGKLNIKYSIEFQNAEFSYPDGRQAIKGITFTAQPGETVALVGPNGSGKSTLIKLLLKLYEAQQGDIVIAGKSIKLWNPFHLRSLISYVPQENYLFPSNLEENIHLGKPGAPFEEVLTAARLAGVQDFISKLPQGYETLLSETAINLSGGERQRISLARAFLKNSPILILDEAVSQVDSQSEEIIRETMRHLSAGRTVIIIAHRLSTVLQSDKIVVLNEGKVEAVGKHGELYQNCQLYRQLCESQFLKLPERVNV